MLGRVGALLFVGLTLCSGCAVEPEGGTASQVGEATEGQIDYLMWEAPEQLVLDEPADGVIAYSECKQTEPLEGDIDVQIVCGRAWTEVAWYRVDGATLQDARELNVSWASEALLRVSIHRVNDDGSTTKVASTKQGFDGDVLSAPVEAASDHYVYVGKGKTLLPLWGTGKIAFSLNAFTALDPR